jgi:hypothetical protein
VNKGPRVRTQSSLGLSSCESSTPLSPRLGSARLMSGAAGGSTACASCHAAVCVISIGVFAVPLRMRHRVLGVFAVPLRMRHRVLRPVPWLRFLCRGDGMASCHCACCVGETGWYRDTALAVLGRRNGIVTLRPAVAALAVPGRRDRIVCRCPRRFLSVKKSPLILHCACCASARAALRPTSCCRG